MFRLFSAILLAVCLVATVADAQNNKIVPYGFASVEAPNAMHSNYQWQWARLGVTAYPREEVGKDLLVHFQYDVSTNVFKLGYLQYNGLKWHGGYFSTLAGLFVHPARDCYPVSMTLRLTRSPDLTNDLPVSVLGGAVWYTHGGWIVRTAHYATGNSTHATLRLGWNGADVYWLDSGVVGMTVKRSFGSWLNLFVGFTNYHGDKDVAFVQNYVQLPAQLRLYGQYDFGQTNHKQNYLIGLNWEYAPFSFAKLFYEPRVETLQAQLAFAF